ncbi:MAG: DUF4328 domain-containing protein [bacterium]|nr:DUF4328 domain-containing protein [bacterium]
MWYYNDGTDKPNGPHSEETIRQLTSQRVILPTTLVWKEGMTDWSAAEDSELRPFFGFPPSAAAVSPESRPTPSHQNYAYRQPEYVYRDISSLGFWLQLFLVFDMVVTIATAAFSSAMLEMMGMSGGSIPRFDVSPDMMGKFLAMSGVGVLSGLIGLVTIILFLVWCYRGSVNARALGASGMSFSPAWAVGWWFIPLANLIMPYFVVKEFYKAGKSPDNWQSEECDMIVHVWFGCWAGSTLVGWIIGCYAAFQSMSFAGGPQMYSQFAYIGIPSTMLQIAAGISAMVMIGRLSAYQKASAATKYAAPTA